MRLALAATLFIACGSPQHPALVDTDHDGIADVDDKCPQDPETKNGLEDTDGCPDQARVAVYDAEPGLELKIFFAENSAVIQPIAGGLLDAAAEAMLRQRLAQIEVDGYAEANETDPALPTKRATAVRDALVNRGIPADHMRIVGREVAHVVPAEPGADRRVDFTIVGATPRVKPPIADADRDGMADDVDKCPEVPEVINGVDDEDGCPDRPHDVIFAMESPITTRIYFARNSAVLATTQNKALDAIAAQLTASPELVRLEIGGYASDDERDVRALTLSRATVVRDALIARGIAADRFSTFGYGRVVTTTHSDQDRHVQLEVTRVRGPDSR